MAHPAAVLVESALRARKLDRTLTTAHPPFDRALADPAAFVATRLAELDDCTRGGLPRGALSEIVGPRSSGRTTVLMHMLSAATRRGELVALVDTCDRLDVASVTAAGAELDRFLWVRGASEGGAVEQTVERALKAFNLVLQAGGFGVVVLDLADVPSSALRRIPFTTWLRVQRVIEGSDTAAVLVVSEPMARSPHGLTVSLSGRPTWVGTDTSHQRFDGLDTSLRVVSSRLSLERRVTTHAMAIDDTPDASMRARCVHECVGVASAHG